MEAVHLTVHIHTLHIDCNLFQFYYQIMQQQKMRSEEDEEKSFLFAMNSKLPFASPGLRCSVWTVNKINRLRNQSTHSWKGIYSATATARWFTYLLSLCAVDVVESFFSLRVLVSPTLLRLSAARHNNGFVILFHWKTEAIVSFQCHLMKAAPIDFFSFIFVEERYLMFSKKTKKNRTERDWGNTTRRINEMILIICDFSCSPDSTKCHGNGKNIPPRCLCSVERLGIET